jgi:NitT/TauT family transport system ATP-binding protein
MAAAAQPHVEFRSVTKRFGDGPVVLDRLSLEVGAGEFVSLIGPSGCGKSTLLRLIAALSPVTSGEVLVDGRPPARGQRETAFIFQDPTLLPWLTVQGNIEVPLRIRGVVRAERRQQADKLLQLVRLADVRDRYPRQLSGGMKMRVSVARALVQSPRLLLMDEPFGALDEMTRHHLNEELLEIRRAENWTAFFVTHSVAEAVFLSSRILVLAANPGRVVADVAVPFGYPRDAGLRGRGDYHALVDEVADLLRRGEEAAVR